MLPSRKLHFSREAFVLLFNYIYLLPGIGKETCLLLAQKGAKIVVADINFDEALTTVSLLHDKYADTSQSIAIKCDVSKTSDVQKMVDATVEKFGGLDAAVNCAGIGGLLYKTEDYPEDEFDNLMKVNVRGVFLCMKYELSQMMKQSKANHYAIVNVSSFSGIRGHRLNSPYAATKHAVIGMTKSTALEYARSGVRVNAVCPTFTITPMMTRLVPTDSPQAQKMASSVPMNRLGTPDEVAAAIIWLLSDASFTTGHALTVDGGLSSL